MYSQKGICGFNNIGNSCYFNSYIQCLLQIPEFRGFFFTDQFKSNFFNNMIEKFKSQNIIISDDQLIDESIASKIDSHSSNSISDAIYNLVKEIIGSNFNSTIAPRTLYNLVIKLSDGCLISGQQSDPYLSFNILLSSVRSEIDHKMIIRYSDDNFLNNNKQFISEYVSEVKKINKSDPVSITNFLNFQKNPDNIFKFILAKYNIFLTNVSRESLINNIFGFTSVVSYCCTTCTGIMDTVFRNSFSFDEMFFCKYSFAYDYHLTDLLDWWSRIQKFPTNSQDQSNACTYHCPDICRTQKTTFIKVNNIWKTSNIFTIYIRRANNSQKINTPITFPINLDISKYYSKYSKFKSTHNKYKISGFCCHSGSVSGGHYYSYTYNYYTNEWIHCDDTSVSVVSLDCIKNILKNNTSIMLVFYRLIPPTVIPIVTPKESFAEEKTEELTIENINPISNIVTGSAIINTPVDYASDEAIIDDDFVDLT